MKNPRTTSLLLAAALLAGCGGGGSHGTSASRGGHVSFTVTWPARARYIPTAANYIRVTITDSAGTTDTVAFTQSDVGTGGQTVTRNNTKVLAEGTCTLLAESFDSVASATAAKPLASGTNTVQVVAGATTNQTVTMASTLTGFSGALTDLTEGTALGAASYPFSPGAPGAGPSVPATALVQLTVAPQNATPSSLTLYPTASDAATTTLSALGSFAAYAGFARSSTSSVVGILVPTTATAATGGANVVFADGAHLTPISATLALSVNALTVTDTVTLAPSPPNDIKIDSVAAVYSGSGPTANRGYALVHTVDSTDIATPNHVVVRDERGNLVVTLGASPTLDTTAYALGAIPGHYAYGPVGGSLVKTDDGSLVSLGAGTLRAMASYGSDIYLAIRTGTTTTVYKLDFSVSTPGLSSAIGTLNGAASTLSSLAIGRDTIGGLTAYTVEAGSVLQYRSLNTGSGSARTNYTSSLAGGTPTSVTAYGNVVFVATSTGVQTLNYAGTRTGSVAVGPNSPSLISVAKKPGTNAGEIGFAARDGSSGAPSVEPFSFQ